tara:strand:- start:1155 stop:2459 length:1305 start_codon:yes stop_codon:yes gene_type:complete
MNEYDSNRIADLAIEQGYILTDKILDTDCYVLNTCHIREKATEKVYSDVGRLKKKFRNKKKPIVLITGCVAQAENENMLKREPYIDAVIGPQSYQHISKILSELDKRKKKINSTEFDVIEKFDKISKIKNTESKVSSFITIQEGCDKFCNFCVVPYTRGPEFSRSPVDIINEAKNLISNGAKEITLLGQNVNAYNYTKGKEKFKLSYLINNLEGLERLKRIRYTTSHPKDMSKDLINCYRNTKKLMPFLHLPVQSGSNNVLKNMNRKHSRDEYLAIIKDLLKIRPNMKFSSDFIVGYPGETDKDFEDTISLVKEVNFINSYSFIYSPRPGTPASKIENVNNTIQKKRLITLQTLLKNIQIKKNHNEVGKFKEILVENKLKNQEVYFGRSSDLTPVIIKEAKSFDIGNIVKVKIEGFNHHSLSGTKKIIKNEEAA